MFQREPYFWKNCLELSERSRHKGVQYACESYIHCAICGGSIVSEEKFKVEEEAHRSQCKRQDTPHLENSHEG